MYDIYWKFNKGDIVCLVGWLAGKEHEKPMYKAVINERMRIYDEDGTTVVPGYNISAVDRDPLVVASSYNVLERWLESVPKEPEGCVCDLQKVLMVSGCRCGWIEKERAAKE